MAMGLQAVSHAIGKPVGALLLGGVVLWQVAVHAGPVKGRAIVHVVAAPADVTIDGTMYHIEDLYQPAVVCELSPGDHKVQMLRAGRVVYRDEIRIRSGEDVVLVAWERDSDGSGPGRAD
jgi:hypothetical protein